ncbi:hypothetical protein [Cohnella sp. GbtcB17]|uniref:hypothetical protein n=1 Tax=Cohnella sp. GbtcB17 TaxID=2824762 RepID=UPI001C2F2287|nr:hypothetical protein [Cohnella sp. GbtcB17]
MRDTNFIYERPDHRSPMSQIKGSQREISLFNSHDLYFQSHIGILYRRKPASVRRLFSTA